MKTAKKTPSERQRLKKALDAVQSAKRHLAYAHTCLPSHGALVRLEAELLAALKLTGPVSFNFGANVAEQFNRVTFPPGTVLAPALRAYIPPPFQAPFHPLKCWHDNELTLDGPAAKCGCTVTMVHDDIHVVTKERR